VVVGGIAAGVLGAVVGVGLAVDLRLGVALAFAALGIPLALIDLPLIVALWAALAVFYKYPGFGLALTAVGLLACGGWLAHARADPARIRSALAPHRPLLVLIALLLVWLTLSLAWAADPARAATGVASWYVNAAALVVLLTSLRTPRDVRIVVAAVVGAVAASAALGLMGFQLGGVDGATVSEGRLQGASGDPNFMAAFIVAAAVLATVLYSASASPWRVALPVILALLLVGLAGTESRGGMLAFVTALLVAVAVMRGRRIAALSLLATVGLIAVAWISANPAALDRVRDAPEDRGNGREDLWLVAQRMSADHPITGVGLDNFVVRSPDYVRRPGAMNYVELIVERPHEVHNTYLQMLAETGAIGLGLFLLVLWTALASALRAARVFDRAGRPGLAVLSRGVFVATIGLLTAAIFLTAQATATVWVMLALGPVLLGVAVAHRVPPAEPHLPARIEG
jgi:O-antigen ligase